MNGMAARAAARRGGRDRYRTPLPSARAATRTVVPTGLDALAEGPAGPVGKTRVRR
jgi:hypothetical protein